MIKKCFCYFQYKNKKYNEYQKISYFRTGGLPIKKYKLWIAKTKKINKLHSVLSARKKSIYQQMKVRHLICMQLVNKKQQRLVTIIKDNINI